MAQWYGLLIITRQTRVLSLIVPMVEVGPNIAEIHLKHILTIQGMVRSVCTFTENLVRLLGELK